MASQASGSMYENVPLTDPGEQIRLLHLCKTGTAITDPVECSLISCDLQDAPNFIAISYTWGDPASQSSILIDAVSFPVTQNCHYALWQTRLHHPEAYVWVDAICINQEDNDEKGPQVAIMGTIYSNAAVVLACIGESDEGSDYMFGLLSRLVVVTHECGYSLNERHYEHAIELWNALEHTKDLNMFNHHLANFCSRPYFSRLWVAQELYAGNDRVRLCCGQDIQNWQALLLFAYIMMEAEGEGLLEDPPRSLDALCNVVDDHGLEFPAFFRFARELLCRHPRDRVYGTLGLVDWSELDRNPPVPDYTKPIWDVGLDVLRRMPSDADLSEVANIGAALELTPGDPSASHAMHVPSDDRILLRFEPRIVTILQAGHDQNLTASLCWSTDRSRTLVVLEQMHAVQHTLHSIYTAGRLSGLMHGSAQPGDLIVDYTCFSTFAPNHIAIVLRSHNNYATLAPVGVVIIAPAFELPSIQSCHRLIPDANPFPKYAGYVTTSDALLLGSLSDKSLKQANASDLLATIHTITSRMQWCAVEFDVWKRKFPDSSYLEHCFMEHILEEDINRMAPPEFEHISYKRCELTSDDRSASILDAQV